MKKFISVLMAALLCLSLAACGSEIETAPATEEQLGTVTETVVNYLTSDSYKAHRELYKTAFGTEPSEMELISAYTFKCDMEGFDMDLLLLRVKGDIAVDHAGEIYGYEYVQIAIDNKSGTVYNSAELMAKLDSFDGTITSEETAVMMLMNNPVLIEGGDGTFWSETEESTKFAKDDIKAVNDAING